MHHAAAFPLQGQAWTWQHGPSPTELVLVPVRVEAPGPGDVVVRNVAIGLNPVDWKVIAAAPGTWTPGHVPGVDGAGEVVAVGQGVDPGLLGRRVAYHTSLGREGSFAQYAQVAARALLQVPDTMDLLAAAGIPCPALTAWMALDKVPARPGAPVLVSGAGGAVGQYLVQLALAQGFQVSVLCHPRHWGRLRALGVSETFDNTLPLPDATRDRFFAAFDSVSDEHAGMIAPVLAASGHLVCIQGRVPQWPTTPFGRTLSLHEVALGALHVHGDDAAWARMTTAGNAMLQQVAQGTLRADPLVVTEAFAALPAHLEALRLRAGSGKYVVRVSAA